MAVKAGSAFVELYVTGKERVNKQLSAMQSRLKKFGSAVKAMSKALAGGVAIGAALGTAAGAGLFGLAKQAAATGDAVAKMSDRTGASAEFLSQMGFAAEQSGTSLDQLGRGLFRMRRRIGNFATGTGPAKRALEDLGFAADHFVGMGTEQTFEEIVRKLEQVEDPALRAQYAYEVFGDQAQQLMPMLSAGADGMAAMRAEADALGRTISTDTAQQSAAFNDQLNRLQSMFKGLMQQIGTALIPVFLELMAELQAAASIIFGFGQQADSAGQVVDNFGGVMEWVKKPIEFALRAWYTFTGALKAGQGVVAAIGASIARLVATLADMAASTGIAGSVFGDSLEGLKETAANMEQDLTRLANEKFELSAGDFDKAFGNKLRDMMDEERARFKALSTKIDTTAADFEIPQRDFKQAASSLTHAADKMVESASPQSLEANSLAAFQRFQENRRAEETRILRGILDRLTKAPFVLGMA